MKAFRKAKRTVTRSVHADLHHKIEEERDVAKIVGKAAATLKGSTERTVAWGDTTESSVLLAFAEMESEADAQWADALAEYGAARAAYADVWAEVLEKERARDSAKKAHARAEAALESAQGKLAKSQGKANFEQKREQLEGAVATAETELRDARDEAERLTAECEKFSTEQLVAATRANAAASLALCELGSRVYTDLESRCSELVTGSGSGSVAARVASAYAAPSAAVAAVAAVPAAATAGMFGSDDDEPDAADPGLHAATASGAGLNPFDTEPDAGAAAGSGAVAVGNPFDDDPFADPSPPYTAAPAAAATPFDDSDDGEAEAPPVERAGTKVRAIADYAGDDEGELGFAAGEILWITNMEGDWYYGSNAAGEEGDIPSNFVETA